MPDSREAPIEPREALAVTFFEHPVLAARLSDGTIYLSVRDLCDATGLNFSSQSRRLQRHQDLSTVVRMVSVWTPGGKQSQLFIRLEYVAAWVISVDRSRASEIVQQRLRFLWEFSVKHVYNAIAETAALPAGPSSNIEDLHDLRRFDDAIIGIAAKTQALEESLEKARQAWRDHERRLRELEAQVASAGPLSNAQRGQVYQLVHIVAQARADREQIPFGRAIAGTWAGLKTKYKVAKYELIPAAKYQDCLAYLRQLYHDITGEPMAGEQLDFLENDESQ